MSTLAYNSLWPIPGSKCKNCHAELAWRNGVGRLVITHAHGEDRCTFICAVLTETDKQRAQDVLDELEQQLVAYKEQNNLVKKG